MYLIATSGRTGSSLLMHLMNNMSDKISIAGELFDFNFFKKLYYKERLTTKDIRYYGLPHRCQRQKYTGHPFYIPNNIPLSILNKSQINSKLATINNDNILDYVFPSNTVSGVKILLAAEEITFILQHFTQIKIIILIRNHIDVYNSMKKKKWTCDINKIQQHNARCRELSLQYPDRVYLVDYDDIINCTDRFVKLFDFIGIEFSKPRYQQFVQQKCSY